MGAPLIINKRDVNGIPDLSCYCHGVIATVEDSGSVLVEWDSGK